MNKFVLAILFVFSFQVFALDTGTGADGPCVDVDLGDAVAVSALNCSSLTITGNKDIAPNGGTIVKIKVLGEYMKTLREYLAEAKFENFDFTD